MTQPRPFPLVALAVLGLGALAATPGSAADLPEARDRWPAWRGPAGHGIADGAHVPLEWSATENVLWKFEMLGQNPLDEWVGASPAVTGERIYIRGETHLFAIGRPPAS